MAPILSPLTNNKTQIFLNWTQVAGATIYYIYRASIEITSPDGLIPIGTTTVNYSVNTVPTSGTYYYVNIAGNSMSNSSISNCENVTVYQRESGDWIYFVIIPAIILSSILLIYIIRKKKMKKKGKSPIIDISTT